MRILNGIVGQASITWRTNLFFTRNGMTFKVVQRPIQIQRRLVHFTGSDGFGHNIAPSLGFITDILEATTTNHLVKEGDIFVGITWYKPSESASLPFEGSQETCAYLYSRTLGGHMICRLQCISLRQVTFYRWNLTDQLVILV
jgi:hypothetical protein